MRALATVPAVVGPRLPDIDLFPCALPDIVDIQLARAGLEREAEGVAEPPGKGFLAFRLGRAPIQVAAPTVGALEWVIGRDAAISRDPQNLAQQDELIARSIIFTARTAVAVVIGAAVA